MATTEIDIAAQGDIVKARREGRELARQLGFRAADQTRLATAISELARNVVQYAGQGTCTFEYGEKDGEAWVGVVVEDHGPGIDNVDAALEFGFSTSGGLGAGLPGTRQLVQAFGIESASTGTRVKIEIRRRKNH